MALKSPMHSGITWNHDHAGQASISARFISACCWPDLFFLESLCYPKPLSPEDSMAEPRSRVYHRNRVAETLREEIGTMLEGQLSDPRIAFCYVTEVAMNPGSKSAKVYIAVDGGEEAEKQTVEALVAAKGFIRHELLERLGVRRVPDLSFHVDRSEKFQTRIDELLGRARKRQKASAPRPTAPAADAESQPTPSD